MLNVKNLFIAKVYVYMYVRMFVRAYMYVCCCWSYKYTSGREVVVYTLYPFYPGAGILGNRLCFWKFPIHVSVRLCLVAIQLCARLFLLTLSHEETTYNPSYLCQVSIYSSQTTEFLK